MGIISAALYGTPNPGHNMPHLCPSVKAAIKVKQEELDTIYGVESAASDLAALIGAQREEKEAFESEMAERRAAFETEMQQSRVKWEKEETIREEEAKELAEGSAKQRKREKEEYEYGFARERAQKKGALEDEFQALEKEIAKKREDSERDTSLRKKELDAREEAIAGREKDMAALEEEADSYPDRLEAAVARAVKETTDRLTQDFAKDKALMESKSEGEKNVLSSKLESVEALLQNQTTQIADLVKGHEQAYEKVQDIANRAVAAAKHEIISVPVGSSSAPRTEDDRKD